MGQEPASEFGCEGIETFARAIPLEYGATETVGPRGSHILRGRDIGSGPDISSEEDEDQEQQRDAIEIVPRLVEWACSTIGFRLTALLGDFGIGKTVTCQLLTQALLRISRKDNPTAPLPLYFDLRNIDSPADAGPASLEKAIGDMLRRAGDNPPSAHDVINYVREKEALVIFDGLDEVTNKLTNEQAIRLYRELLSIVPASTWADTRIWRGRRGVGGAAKKRSRGPRILVSCRTHYFRDVAMQRSFLAGMDRAGIDEDQDIQVFLLLPFTSKQVEEYLRLHLGPEKSARAIELIDETYNLRQLAERPILLRFIRETIGRLEVEKLAGRSVNVCRLYDILVEQTLARDDPKHVIPMHEKRILLRRLAHTLHSEGLSELSHVKLNEWFIEATATLPRLSHIVSGVGGLTQSEIFLQDLRNASLLVRPGETSFRFAHASIREHFLADALHRSVCDGHGEVDFEIPMPSPETLTFLLGRLAIADKADRRRFNERFPFLLTTGRSVAVRQVAFAIWLASGGTLARPSQMDLSGLDFFGRVFAGTKGRLLPLQASRWHGASLGQAEFAETDLSGADFTGARARMSRWLGCRLVGAAFNGADLQGSTWRDVDLSGGLLTNADLRDAEVVSCRMDGAPWRPVPQPEVRFVRPVRLGHDGKVNAVAAVGLLAQRNTMVSAGADGTVRLWDITSGRLLRVLSGHTGPVRSVAVGRSLGQDVIVSGGDSETVRVWDPASGALLRELSACELGVFGVALGRVGDRDVIVSGCHDGMVRQSDAATGAVIAELGRYPGGVIAVAAGRIADRDVVVSACDDGSVQIWDAANGEVLPELSGHTGAVSSIALGCSMGQEVIVSGGNNGKVRLWDAVTGAVLGIISGHRGSVRAVALGRIGGTDCIASGGFDGTVRLWDAATGAILGTMSGHHDEVRAVAVTRVGGHDLVLSGGGDGTLRLWGAASGELLAELSGTLSPPGKNLVGPDPETLLDLVQSASGDYCLARQSPDAWRYWRAQGVSDGRLVTLPIDDMPYAAHNTPARANVIDGDL